MLVLTGHANESGVSYTFNGAKKGVTVLFSLAFLVFCSTLAYHVYSLNLHKRFAFQKKNHFLKVSSGEHSINARARPPVMTTYIPELREPLLDLKVP